MTIPSELISYINYILVAFIIIQMIFGYRKGILYQLFSLLGVFISIFVSWYFAPILAKQINIFPERWTPFVGTSFGEVLYDQLNSLAWYVLLFFAALIIIAIIKVLVKAFSELPVVGTIDSIFGAVFSLIPSALVIVMVSYFVSSPLVVNGQEVMNQTILGPVHDVTKNVVTFLKTPYLTQEALQKLTNGEKLTQEESTELWNWLMTKDADPEEMRQFIKDHSESTTIPVDNTENTNP